MHYRPYYIITILCIWAIQFSKAANLDFDSYTTDDGLSSAYITSIIKDSDGFMWIGTQYGLNKFDGISFKHYYYNENDSSSLPGNYINSLTKDNLGNLWIATMNGACYYNKEKDNFSQITFDVEGELSKNTYINKIFSDSRGSIWFSTFQGIFKIQSSNYSAKNKTTTIKAQQYFLAEEDIENAFKHNITSIQEDKKGKIWFPSYSRKLFYYDYEKNEFLSIRIKHPDENKFSNKPKALLIDSEGIFHLSINEVGVFSIDTEGNIIKLNNKNGPKGKLIPSIIEDKKGNIWFGDVNKEGLSIYDKERSEFTYLQSDDSNPKSLLTNKINTIYEDNTGTIWIGTIIGLNKYSPDKNKFNRYFWQYNKNDGLSFNNILCFEESNNGDIWIGTDGGGLNKFNRVTKKFTHFKHDPNNPKSLSSNSIVSICEDSKGVLWLGTFNGGLVKRENEKFTTYKPIKGDPYSISNLHIWNVLEDSKENLWVATLNSGLHLFDRKNNRFYTYLHEEDNPNSLANIALIQLFEDSKQNLYISSYMGVSVVNINDIDFSASPPKLYFKNLIYSPKKNSISRNVYCINEDLDGHIWFGTIGNGIDKYDPKTGIFTNYNTQHGLPGNTITSILIDDSNSLWLATNNGLALFNPKTTEVITYKKTDGLLNTDLKGWALKAKDGEMFFGGISGFNSFYPKDVLIGKNSNIPPLVFTGLRIFNSPVQIGEKIHGRVILEKNISITKKITLTHLENFIAISFAALDYAAPEKNQYKYKMEGFNDEWIDAGDAHEAVYTNLDPDTYTFRVKASNNDGEWNEEGISIQIIILPPWWETPWFRILAVFFIVFVFVLFVFLRIKQLKSQKKRLEILVNEKTTELLQKNELLLKQSDELTYSNRLLEENQCDLEDRQEEIQTQNEELLKQKESLEILNTELNELNATKDKFFSIIAHDVRSPFNAILGFSELLLENYQSMDDETRIETIKIMNESSQNLFLLLENLLNWSRAQRGVISFEPEYINCNKVITEIFKLLDGVAKTKEISLTNQVHDKNTLVFADRFMFDTILRNLIGNALKFTKRKGEIVIKTEIVKDYLIIEVADNGVGIPRERLSKLFRIDTNQSTKGTNDEKGTGLGLILVKDFVNLNGGKIWVESEEGKGSKFIFSLPLNANN